MRMVRVISVLLLGLAVTVVGMGSAQAGEECNVAVLCPPPTIPGPTPTPEPAPTPEPTPSPSPSPAPAPAPAPAPSAPPAGDEPASADRLFALVNQSRADHGLGALSPHAEAAAIAFEHSRQMAARHDIWHNDALFTAETKRRLGARSVAENVAMNTSADGAHERLMASDGHRTNILTAKFTTGAVGAVRGDDGRLYVTEVFIEPVAAAPVATTAAPKPAKAPKAPTAPKAAAKPAAAPTATAETVPAPVVDATTSTVPADSAGSDAAASGDDVELASGLAFPKPSASGDASGRLAMFAVLALVGVLAGVVVAVRRRTSAAA